MEGRAILVNMTKSDLLKKSSMAKKNKERISDPVNEKLYICKNFFRLTILKGYKYGKLHSI